MFIKKTFISSCLFNVFQINKQCTTVKYTSNCCFHFISIQLCHLIYNLCVRFENKKCWYYHLALYKLVKRGLIKIFSKGKCTPKNKYSSPREFYKIFWYLKEQSRFFYGNLEKSTSILVNPKFPILKMSTTNFASYSNQSV